MEEIREKGVRENRPRRSGKEVRVKLAERQDDGDKEGDLECEEDEGPRQLR